MCTRCSVTKLKQRSRRKKGKIDSRRLKKHEETLSNNRGQSRNLLSRGSPSLKLYVNTSAGSVEHTTIMRFALSKSLAVLTSTYLKRSLSQRSLSQRNPYQNSPCRRSKKLRRWRSLTTSLLRCSMDPLRSHQLKTTLHL